MFTKIKEETIHAIPGIIYFAVCFNLIHFIGALSRQPGDIKYYSYVGVTVFALVVGKSIILVNMFPFINAFPHKPIIYNIFWKLLVYNAFLLLVRILDIFAHVSYHLGIEQAGSMLLYELKLPMFWASEVCIVFIFLGYIIFSEFVRVLGKEKVLKIIFG